MIALASVVAGFLAGYLVRDRLRAYAVWFAIWWVTLIVQTLTVIRDEDQIDYWLLVTVILVLGIVMVWLGGRVRAGRTR